MGLFDALARETTYITAVTRTLIGMRAVRPESTHTIVDIVAARARRSPDATVFYHLDSTMSYGALNAAADRVAHWAHGAGVGRGDAVALLMENRPQFVAAWLGVLKVGAVAALINTNLRGAALAHSIAISGARHVIVGAELDEAFLQVAAQIAQPPTGWRDGGPVAGMEDLDAALAAAPATAADPAWRHGVTCADKAFYIYTSGTTGLPKASNFTHLRMPFMMHGFAGGLNAKASDRMYNVLPLYHSAGGVCALGPALLTTIV